MDLFIHCQHYRAMAPGKTSSAALAMQTTFNNFKFIATPYDAYS